MAHPESLEELDERVDVLKTELAKLTMLRRAHPEVARLCDRHPMDSVVRVAAGVRGVFPDTAGSADQGTIRLLAAQYLFVALTADQNDGAGKFAESLDGAAALRSARAYLAAMKRVQKIVADGTPFEWAIAFELRAFEGKIA